ncbi:MAG: carboxypeptidase regulatory-like domain-containing protein, partial [Pyrinomonadaceae bacterium]
MKTVINRVALALGTFLLALSAAGGALAQSGTSSVRGTVTDPQGNVVAGASVTLSDAEKAFTRTQTTVEDGGYVFNSVPPGVYTLVIEAQGFKKVLASEVRAEVNTPTDFDVRLEVGSVSEEIGVSASVEAPLNTTDATIGNTFTERQILQLPLDARNVAGLLSLQPGVTFIGNVDQRGETTDYRNGSVNGGKSDQSNVTLDGVDVNDQQNQFAFNSVLRVTPDSVQEFRVTTTNPNAEQGRSSGAQISLVTKSGSNDWHGSLYEFHRNTVTTANTFFNNAAGSYGPNDAAVRGGFARAGDARVPRPKLLRNLFGGRLAGPILKDRLFFFFNYEGRRDAREESVLRTVPTASLRQGIYRYNVAGGGFAELTPAQINTRYGFGPNAAVLAVLQQYPLPNTLEAGDGRNTQGFRFNAPVSLKWNTYTARFDFNLTRDGRHNLSWRGILQDDAENSSPQYPGLAPNTNSLNNSKGFAVNYLAALTPAMTSTLRYGFTRQDIENAGAATAAPVVTFTGLSSLVSTSRNFERTTPVHNLVEDISWVRGKHTFQFGGNVRYITNSSVNFSNSYSTAQTRRSRLTSTTPLRIPGASDRSTEESLVTLLGLVTYANAIYNYDSMGRSLAPGEPLKRDFGASEYEVYGQDSWRVRPNLTISFGLRYSLYSPPYEKNGNQVAPSVRLGEWFELRRGLMEAGRPAYEAPRISFDLAGPVNNRRGFYDWDKNNFAPRVAFAYSPSFKSGWLARLTGGEGATVLRGGYAIVYDRIGASLATVFDSNNAFGLSNQFEPALTSVATAPRFTGLNNLPSTLPPDPGTGFPATPPNFGQSNAAIDDTLTTPYSEQINFSVQRQLPKSFTLEVAYVGRLGHNLLVNDDVAMPLNLRDSRSGVDYFTAIDQLLNFTSRSSVTPIAFWENLFPGLAGAGLTATQGAWEHFSPNGDDPYGPDYITGLEQLDRFCNPVCSTFGPNAFFDPQYVNLNTFRSIMPTSYHAMQVLLRKRFSAGTQFDFNYTLSKSIDWSSRAERNGLFVDSSSTINAWQPNLRQGPSEYDMRHNLNFNGIAELPLGRGRKFGGDLSGWQDAILGGWQLSGIWRWTSGLPTWIGNGSNWPTNWKWSAAATSTGPVP